ncbi:MAG: MarR family transcriptional regulator [Anaerovorax sp.]
MKETYAKRINEVILKSRPLMMREFVRPIKALEKTSDSGGNINLLSMIDKQGTGISMTDLSLLTCVSKPNMTIMADKLCADGYIERHADSNDRRIVLISITDKGRTRLNAHREKVTQFVNAQLMRLEESDIEKLAMALEDMVEVLEKLDALSR